jgi:hypothetical protein
MGERRDALGDRTEPGFGRLRSGLSVTRDSNHDEVLVPGAQSVVPEVPPFHRPWAEVLEHEVHVGREIPSQALTRLGTQIERHLTLVLRDVLPEE